MKTKKELKEAIAGRYGWSCFHGDSMHDQVIEVLELAGLLAEEPEKTKGKELSAQIERDNSKHEMTARTLSAENEKVIESLRGEIDELRASNIELQENNEALEKARVAIRDERDELREEFNEQRMRLNIALGANNGLHESKLEAIAKRDAALEEINKAVAVMDRALCGYEYPTGTIEELAQHMVTVIDSAAQARNDALEEARESRKERNEMSKERDTALFESEGLYTETEQLKEELEAANARFNAIREMVESVKERGPALIREMVNGLKP